MQAVRWFKTKPTMIMLIAAREIKAIYCIIVPDSIVPDSMPICKTVVEQVDPTKMQKDLTS